MSTLYIKYPSSVSSSSFPLLAPNGSASAPSYSFTNASNTGMYLSGTSLAFATGGVLAGTITTGQRWNIGSTVTEAQVHQINAIDTLQALGGHLVLSNGAAASLQFIICKDRSDGSVKISGGGSKDVGAEIELYGSTFGSGLNNAFKVRQSNSDMLVLDTNGIFTVSGQLVGKGTATNNSAAAGYIGEYIESVQGTATNVPAATGVWGNMTSISLTAGDWEVSGILELSGNGSTVVNPSLVAISINSGGTTSDHVVGSNQVTIAPPGSGAGSNRSVVIPSYRLLLSGTTTVYWKANITFSVATPQTQFRLSARRMR